MCVQLTKNIFITIISLKSFLMDLLVKFHYNVDNHTRDKDDGSREEYVGVRS